MHADPLDPQSTDAHGTYHITSSSYLYTTYFIDGFPGSMYEQRHKQRRAETMRAAQGQTAPVSTHHKPCKRVIVAQHAFGSLHATVLSMPPLGPASSTPQAAALLACAP
mmetsp:Transcript_28876/g.74164  ORF Transcript_28876/g.74164 Transcript_28876/m.74164 type:complete len:109 (-) Transcript_28876:237-563(-)